MGITVGKALIPYYGIWIFAGVSVAFFFGWVQIKKFHADFDEFITLVGCVGIGAIIGAKLLYVFVSWNQIDFTRITDLHYLQMYMAGGFVFYGGLFGGIIGMWLCERIFHIDTLFYAGIAIPCIPIAHAFGRMGCNAVGCCYGIPYNGIGAIVYEHSAIAPNGISLFPVQKVEAIINIVIAVCLIAFVNRYEKSKKYSLLFYLISYAIARFFLEFFRYDNVERGGWKLLSTSQWCGVLIIAAIVCACILYRKNIIKKKE